MVPPHIDGIGFRAVRRALTLGLAAVLTAAGVSPAQQDGTAAAPANTASPAQRRARNFAESRLRSNGSAAALQAARAQAADLAALSAARSATATRDIQSGRTALASGPARAAAGVPTASTTSLSTAWQAVGPMQVSTAAYGLVTGRVTSVALDPSDTTGNTVYVGTTGGGVWKSTNAAGAASSVSFAPLTDTLPVFSPNAGTSSLPSLSIGAVSVQPGGTGVLLAGTGDPNDATDSYYGEGILRSADNGTTWTLVQQSNDGTSYHAFVGEGFAGFAWSTSSPNVVVAAVSSSAEDSNVGGSVAGTSARGLYVSTDAGVTWQMATVRDTANQFVQRPSDTFSATYEGNAATAVVWNPVRQMFYAAVRFHGYYQSADGVTWTRMTAQPGAGLTTAACPTRNGTTGVTSCPIFRGALAVQPVSGDLFALSVDAANGDTGLYRDVCSNTGSACASSTVQWAQKLTSTPLEDGSGSIAQGDYNLTLAAVPAATALSINDTLLFAGTADLYRCRLSDGCSLRNTTNATTGCAAPAGVAPAQHAVAYQTNSSNTAAPLLYFGNDGGLWRSTDGVNQQSTSCSADDAAHFDNLNGALGSLAEVNGLSTHPTDGGIALVALGALGSAASTTSSNTGALQTVWTQMGTGESGNVAIDQAAPTNWLLQSGFGVSLYRCTKGTACAAADFTGAPVIGASQINGDAELTDAPLLLDPALNSNVIVGTCRVYRGPAGGGSTWSAGANAISRPLSGPANSTCAGSNGLIRSIGAGGLTQLTASANTSGSPVLYAGLAGSNDGGTNAFGGHFYKTTQGNLANGSTQWTDVTAGTVTNDTTNNGRFNPLGFDVSSISIDPGDSSGLTVYATVMGFNTPLVYRSTDGAASWTNITANLPGAPANAVVVDPNDSNVVYVGLDTGVYVTSDVTSCGTVGAQCWSVYGSALPNAPVTHLVASVAFALPGNGLGVLRAGTYGRGIWQLPLLTAGQSARAVATLSPTSLSFGSQAVGYTSAAQTVTVTNTGNAALTVTRVSASTGFIETDNCAGATLAPASTCSIQVSFAPSTATAQTGTLQVYGNTLGGYASAMLSGTGTGTPAVVVAPASLTFPSTAVKATSAAQTVTVTNNGNLPATLQPASITSDFHLADNTCAGSLAPGASCTLSVTFTPTGTSLRTGLLQLVDNVGTHSVPLSGNGIAGDITVSPTSVQFPDTPLNQVSADRTVTVLNSGNGPLQIGAVTASGDFAESDTCGNTTLAAGQSCSVAVRFFPVASGRRTGTLVIASNAKSDTTSTASVALSGNGSGKFNIVLTPTALNFGSAFVGSTTAVQNVTISNTGASAGGLGAITVSGDYVLKANTCGTTLASQTGCTVSITFAPTSTGTRTGSLTVTDDAGTQVASLTGTGTSAATDTLTPLSLTFASTQVNASSAAQSVSLTNSGDVALTLVAARVTAGNFTAVNGCGPTLAAHSSCSIAVTFSPKSVGALSGTLEIDDVQHAQFVALTGSSVAGPGISLSPSSLAFAATGVGVATSAQVATLTNNGSSAITLGAIAASGDFGLAAGSSTCASGAVVAAGGSCTVRVAFAPAAAGARSGTLTVVAGPSTQTVLLSGQGIDYTFAANGPTSVSVVSGKSATFPLLLTPAVSSTLPVSFTCTGAPSNAKCTVTSQYNDLSATSTVSAVVVTGTTVAMAAPPSRPVMRVSGAWYPLVALAALLPCGFCRRKQGKRSILVLFILAGVVASGIAGCGSGRNTAGTGTGSSGTGSSGTGSTVTTPAGSYNLVVSVTGAGLTRQVPLTLVVTAQ